MAVSEDPRFGAKVAMSEIPPSMLCKSTNQVTSHGQVLSRNPRSHRAILLCLSKVRAGSKQKARGVRLGNISSGTKVNPKLHPQAVFVPNLMITFCGALGCDVKADPPRPLFLVSSSRRVAPHTGPHFVRLPISRARRAVSATRFEV